jgi:hypothetical protein
MEITMNNQEAFTIAATGMLTQRERSTLTTNNTCEYRTTNVSGKVLYCGVGFLLSENLYEEAVESGEDILTLIENSPRVSAHFEGIDSTLLVDLQDVHDAYPISFWKDKLEQVAYQFGLVMPES